MLIKVNCIIIDDEKSSVEILKEMVGRLPFLNLLKSFTNPFEGLDFIQSHSVDLVLLDIEMPMITGIEIAKSLRNKPQIIFTSLDSKYAITGYDLDATDFLLKPLTFDRFLKGVNKASQMHRLNELSGTSNSHDKNSNLDFILVKTGYNTIRIDLDDILYCEGLKDYIKVHITGKTIVTLNSLKKFEELLPDDRFVRVHKSFIISLAKIDSIQNNRIAIGKSIIPIGDNYKTKFNSKIRQ
jgi:two-component system, LytTR family, response regulator